MPGGEGGWVVGLDLGGTKLLAGAVAPDCSVSAVARHIAGAAAGQDEVIELVVRAALEVRDAVGGQVAGVGIGIPCTIDRRTGVAVQAAHLPLLDVPFGAAISERLGVRVVVDNDANAAAVAEARHGAARGAVNAVVLTVGTGIGGALIIDGELYRGSIGAAGEAGHMIIERDGLPCSCGSRGCLETLVSGPALARMAALDAGQDPTGVFARTLAAGEPLDGPAVTRLAHAGEQAAIAVLERMGRALGAGLSSLVNLLDPDTIVVGGGVASAAGELLLGPARQELRARALPPARDAVRVVCAELGERAGMIGAALLAREAH